MTTPTNTTGRNHRRAVRFFWGLLLGATMVSLSGNIAHAVLPYLPRIAVQIGVAAVPPIALLAAVHGIAVAVRAGASGRVYCWAVGAVSVIGVGAFALSFLALNDLMHLIGYSSSTAWVFPVIVDAAVAVATLMLIALGDKPARRPRATGAQILAPRRSDPSAPNDAKTQLKRPTSTIGRTPIQPSPAPVGQGPVHAEGTGVDADIAAELIAAGATTQPIDTVIAVLTACRVGMSINAAARASGINYRTAQRIVVAAEQHRLAVAS